MLVCLHFLDHSMVTGLCHRRCWGSLTTFSPPMEHPQNIGVFSKTISNPVILSEQQNTPILVGWYFLCYSFTRLIRPRGRFSAMTFCPFLYPAPNTDDIQLGRHRCTRRRRQTPGHVSGVRCPPAPVTPTLQPLEPGTGVESKKGKL